MKSKVLAAGLLVLATTVQGRTTSQTRDQRVRDEVIRLERGRNEALINGDFAELDRMTADDYTFITLRGELRTKAEIVQGFQVQVVPQSRVRSLSCRCGCTGILRW